MRLVIGGLGTPDLTNQMVLDLCGAIFENGSS